MIYLLEIGSSIFCFLQIEMNASLSGKNYVDISFKILEKRYFLSKFDYRIQLNLASSSDPRR